MSQSNEVPSVGVRPKSLAARSAAALAAVGLVLLAAGPAGIRLGVLQPLSGFELFGVSILIALGALGAGVVGLFRTRGGARRGRRAAWLGVAFGGGLVGLVALLLFSARGRPPINDITTDPADPPQFVAARRLAPNHGRTMRYPKRFAALQRRAYPDLAPLLVTASPAVALARAAAVAKRLGWHVEADDPAAGRLEATDVSSVFRFVDDIVVRVRPRLGSRGCVVDVRSKSRDGKGDLGVNAARIRVFVALMQRAR